MKPALFTLLALSVLTSCVTERKRLKICQTCPTKSETIVRDSIVRKDSTVYLAGELITDTIRIECPDGAKPTVNTRTKSGKRGKIETDMIDPNKLVVNATIDSAKVALSWNERHQIKSTETVLPCPEQCYSVWELIGAVLGSIGLVVIAAVLMGWKRKGE